MEDDRAWHRPHVGGAGASVRRHRGGGLLTFSQYLRGSALGKAVEAGPQGSRFVSPASLPPDTATAPLGTSETGNYDVGTANISG